jgi:hypothetical protein
MNSKTRNPRSERPAFRPQRVRPSAIQPGGEFYIYFDHYTRPRYYGAVQSADLEHGQDISAQVPFPKGPRPGTVLRVPETVIPNLPCLPENTTKPQP